jgi:hypothetical protein
VKQAVEAVVDDLGRRDDDRSLLDAGEVIGAQFVIDRPVRGDERRHPRPVEHIEGDHDIAVVALLQHHRIAARQLGQRPGLEELDAGLEPVGLAQHRRISRVGDLAPDAGDGVERDELHPVLGEVARDQGVVREDRFGVDDDIALPRA